MRLPNFGKPTHLTSVPVSVKSGDEGRAGEWYLTYRCRLNMCYEEGSWAKSSCLSEYSEAGVRQYGQHGFQGNKRVRVFLPTSGRGVQVAAPCSHLLQLHSPWHRAAQARICTAHPTLSTGSLLRLSRDHTVSAHGAKASSLLF